MFLLFLSPKGQLSRLPFVGAVAAWLLFYVLQGIWFKNTGTNSFNFFLSLALLFLNVHIVFCVYGKRLRDVGRSVWPLISMFALVLLVGIFVMLKFCGLTYFDTLMQHPEIAENAVAMQELHEAYAQELSAHMGVMTPIMAAAPLLFTLWLALQPHKVSEV
jgi:uncharacterized membrane protein YhaH (DUF805 family)